MGLDKDVAILTREITIPGGTERVIADHAEKLEADVWCTAYDTDVYPELYRDVDIKFYGYDVDLPVLDRTVNKLLYVLATDISFLKEYDVVLAETPLSHILAYQAKEKYGLKAIWSCQHPDKELFQDEIKTGYKSIGDSGRINKALSNFVSKAIKSKDVEAFHEMDYVFVNSNNTLDNQVKKAYGEDIDDERVKVTYTPIELFPRVEDYGDYYLSISRVNPDKQFETAINALAEIEEEKPVLKIAGRIEDSQYKKKLLNLAEEKGIELEFWGYVDEEKLFELIACCKVGLFTSEYEDFGLVPAEFISTGKVCFTPATSGIAEILPDRYCYDSKEELVENIHETDSLDYTLRERIEKLNKDYYDALRKAIKE